MGQGITYIGLDVHKRDIRVFAQLPGRKRGIEETIPHELRTVTRWAKKWLREAPGRVVCAYEAGPTGYALHRQLEALGMECQVVAPALIPRRPGDRIKTDRRDARKLGEFLKGGLLTPVHAPTEEEESARDLCRAREDLKADQLRGRHRITKFLLRRGIRYAAGRKHWTAAYGVWLRQQTLAQPAAQAALDDYRLHLEQLDARLQSLDQKIEALSETAPYAAAVGALRCFRGIDTLTAMVLVTELHGIARFATAAEMMAYLGLVPSEHSSGERQRRGGITKAGNGHARKVLIEAAWHARHVPRVSRALATRRMGQPGEAIAIADRAMQRLHRRYWHLLQSGKAPSKVATAIARELAGFVWAALQTTAARL
jgi:transposase